MSLSIKRKEGGGGGGGGGRLFKEVEGIHSKHSQ
jgi:hypothetical protein